MPACKRCKKPTAEFPLNEFGKPSTMCRRCYEDTCARNAKKHDIAKSIKSSPPEGMDLCMACKRLLPLDHFDLNQHQKRRAARGERARCCMACRTRQAATVRKMRHLVYERDPQKKAEYLAERRQAMRNWREKIVAAYAGKCVCCGETTPEFLELDHINGEGGKHRKQIGANSEALYRWCEQHGFPPILQVLCANCHNAKSFYGTCPHQRERS